MPFTLHTVRFMKSNLFVIAAADSAGIYRKLFQVRLTGGTSPSLAVSFAYAPFGPGGLSRLDDTTPGAVSGTHQWFDPNASNLVSNMPKYSHHVDGNAHFSQDGRILTAVRRAACPLPEINGHAFTLHVLGVHKFPVVTERDRRQAQSNKRRFVALTQAASSKKMITLVGSVYRRASYFQMLSQYGMRSEISGDFTKVRNRFGFRDTRALLTSPLLSQDGPDAPIVELRTMDYEIPDNKRDTLLFIGGFDSRNPFKWRDHPGILATRFPAAYEQRDLSRLRWLDLDRQSNH